MNELIDATGLKCPLPVLKTQKKLREMPSGDIAVLLATDPNAPTDIEDLCRMTEDKVLKSLQREDGVFEITILKG